MTAPHVCDLAAVAVQSEAFAHALGFEPGSVLLSWTGADSLPFAPATLNSVAPFQVMPTASEQPAQVAKLSSKICRSKPKYFVGSAEMLTGLVDERAIVHSIRSRLAGTTGNTRVAVIRASESEPPAPHRLAPAAQNAPLASFRTTPLALHGFPE